MNPTTSTSPTTDRESLRPAVIKSCWVGGIMAALTLACYPTIRAQKTAADRTHAISNLKQLGFNLFEFDAEYGRFPDTSTIDAVKKASGTRLTLGDQSSNQLFRQFLVIGLPSEQPYYAKIAGSKKPDDRFDDDAHALEPGECGYGYVAGLSSKADPGTPLMMAPIIPGTTRFDLKPFGGKAVILFASSATMAMPITPSGQVMIGGMDIFDPRKPWWNGKAPDLKWPE